MAVSVDKVMRSNGPRKQHKQRGLWNVHDVDQGSWNGKSRKTRGNAPTCPHWGAKLSFAGLTMTQFLAGVGLYVQDDEPTFWRLEEPITGNVVGYAPAHVAVGYKNAAAECGVTLEVFSA